MLLRLGGASPPISSHRKCAYKLMNILLVNVNFLKYYSYVQLITEYLNNSLDKTFSDWILGTFKFAVKVL